MLFMSYNIIGSQFHPTSQRVFDLRGILTGCPSIFMTKKCETCGEGFSPRSFDVSRGMGRFCSHKCHGQSRKDQVRITCECCGELFFVTPFFKSTARFCSRKCKGKWNSVNRRGPKAFSWAGGKTKRKCLICGKHFKVAPSAITYGWGSFCSHRCKGKWVSANLSGKNSPYWKRVKRNCLTCGKEVHMLPHLVKSGQKFCSRSCSILWRNSHAKTNDTSIEIKIEQELLKRKIKFKKQYPIWQARTIPDFFIEPNICIFADGDYWHSLPHQKQKDKDRTFWLNFLGFKVYRFWEYEIIKSPQNCIGRIKEL